MKSPRQPSPWKAWLLLGVSLWMGLVPGWAVMSGAGNYAYEVAGLRGGAEPIDTADRVVPFFSTLVDTDKLIDGGICVPLCSYEAGAIFSRFEACGALVSGAGIVADFYILSGEQWDQDLGLYYNRARYLNVESGRFWTLDTYEGRSEDPTSLHKYLYASADPANGTDPSGHETMLTITMAQDVHANNQRMAVPNAIRVMDNFRRGWCRITEKTIWQAHHLIGLSFGGKGSRAAARTVDLAKGLTAKMSKELHEHYHQLLNSALKMIAGIPGNTKMKKIRELLAAGELSTEELKAAMLAATGAIDTGCFGVPGYQPLTPRLLKQFAEQGF